MGLTLDCQDRPLVRALLSYAGNLTPDFAGPRSIQITALIDSGADVTIISNKDWPISWPLGSTQMIKGIGGAIPTGKSGGEIEIIAANRDGSLEKPVLLIPLIADVPGTLLGRDFLTKLGVHITNLW